MRFQTRLESVSGLFPGVCFRGSLDSECWKTIDKDCLVSISKAEFFKLFKSNTTSRKETLKRLENVKDVSIKVAVYWKIYYLYESSEPKFAQYGLAQYNLLNNE